MQFTIDSHLPFPNTPKVKTQYSITYNENSSLIVKENEQTAFQMPNILEL